MHQWIGIDHVQLAAPGGCEEKARAFFAGILGMTEIPKPEKLRARGGVWFQCGTHQLHIGVQEPFTPAAKAHPAFAVADLARLRDTLHANGFPAIDDDSIEGTARLHTSDPFGNRLEFVQARTE